MYDLACALLGRKRSQHGRTHRSPVNFSIELELNSRNGKRMVVGLTPIWVCLLPVARFSKTTTIAPVWRTPGVFTGDVWIDSDLRNDVGVGYRLQIQETQNTFLRITLNKPNGHA